VTDGHEGFCLDTSALINPWNIFYALDVAPGYWSSIQRLIASGKVVVSEEVREEIEKVDDGLRAWTRTNVARWHPLSDEVQVAVTEIMAKHPRLVDNRTNRSRADPFVIATAVVVKAVVVTTEGPGSEARPTIPYVCARMNIPCVGVLDFVRQAQIRLSS
jgi:hypothetical protein